MLGWQAGKRVVEPRKNYHEKPGDSKRKLENILLGKSFFELFQRYSFLNAQIEKKEPRTLLAEIIENIARMMDRKMDAVKVNIQLIKQMCKIIK